MDRWMAFLNKVIEACDAYEVWYQKSRFGDYNVESCPMCGAKRQLLVLGNVSYTTYRYQNARLTMPVKCTQCRGRMTASCSYGSRKWTYSNY